MLKAIVRWGWSPILIAVLSLLGYYYEWPIYALAVLMAAILIGGLMFAVSGAGEKKVVQASLKLRQLAGYFNRRFMGDSSLSIFTVIRNLFTVDDVKVWAWARECEASLRIFNTWSSSFISRVETDIGTRQFDAHLRSYLNELWLMNNLYYDFMEQFYEVADNVKLPRETIDLYNRLTVEYNSFAQDFRDNISELRKLGTTEIEPPSIKFAKEIAVVK